MLLEVDWNEWCVYTQHFPRESQEVLFRGLSGAFMCQLLQLLLLQAISLS